MRDYLVKQHIMHWICADADNCLQHARHVADGAPAGLLMMSQSL